MSYHTSETSHLGDLRWRCRYRSCRLAIQHLTYLNLGDPGHSFLILTCAKVKFVIRGRHAKDHHLLSSSCVNFHCFASPCLIVSRCDLIGMSCFCSPTHLSAFHRQTRQRLSLMSPRNCWMIGKRCQKYVFLSGGLTDHEYDRDRR